MTITRNSEGHGMLSYDIVGVASTDGGGIGAIANPEGETLQIIRAFIVVHTASTGGATLSVGVAADATTSANDILNALTLNGVTAGTPYLAIPGGDASKDSLVAAPAPWTAAKYVTLTGSATTAGFTGRLFIEYLHTGV